MIGPRPCALLAATLAALALCLSSCERQHISFTTVDLPDPVVLEKALNEITYRPEQFGALPGTREDSGPAIRQALAAAVAAGSGARVLFSEGRYRVASAEDEEQLWSFVVRGADRLTIQGAGPGTVLVLANPRASGFVFLEGQGIVVKDLAYDHDPAPFTQGRVQSVDRHQGWFDVEIDAGHAMPDKPWLSDPLPPGMRWGMIFPPEGRRIKGDAPDFLVTERAEYNGEGRSFRFHVPAGAEAAKLAHMVPGDRFAQLIRPQSVGCFFFWRTTACRVERVTLRAGPGLGIVGYASDALEVRDCTVAFAEGSDRLVTLNADAFHVAQARIGPIIDGNFVQGIADDAVAINSPTMLVLAQPAPDVVDVQDHVFLEAGDILSFLDPRAGVSLGQRIVRDVEALPGRHRARLSDRVDGIAAGDDPRLATHAHNDARAARGFRVTNNTMEDHRRHGIFVQASGGVIENNTLTGCGGLGIVVANEPDWPLGGIPGDIEIRNNLLRNVGNDMWHAEAAGSAAIVVRASAFHAAPARERLARGFLIENNRIVNAPGAGILLASVDGALVRGNVVGGTDARVPVRVAPAYELLNCARIRMVSNGVVDRRPRTIAAVHIDAACAPGQEGVVVEDLEAVLAPSSLVVDDRRP